jgi:hypothetical protein
MDVVTICTQLEEQYAQFKEDLLKANKNKSANRRARSKSVKIRETFKQLRQQLLEMEKTQ